MRLSSFPMRAPGLYENREIVYNTPICVSSGGEEGL